MIGIVMATMLEAAPFITGLSLVKEKDGPFPVYGNEQVRLVISGIGKTCSAMATTYFIQACQPSCICNIGASGSTSGRHLPGEIYHIAKIIEPDRLDLKAGTPHEHTPDILPGFPLATLSTRDSPLRDPGEREGAAAYAQLADMEGASVAQVCRHFNVRCFLFKFVSDTPEHTLNSDIVRNIESHRDACAHFFRHSILPGLIAAKAAATQQ
ncbi:MAG: hypothetical protein PHT96_09985 [Syntrophorhabdaceae bacterium]|nr:hypothetical protein [Syntrophorhabdaceae bacterium]MDD4196724.1 hypothetical protein [Syntrophorhabdaceae bacterium]